MEARSKAIATKIFGSGFRLSFAYSTYDRRSTWRAGAFLMLLPFRESFRKSKITTNPIRRRTVAAMIATAITDPNARAAIAAPMKITNERKLTSTAFT
jgi:hypothetical protein